MHTPESQAEFVSCGVAGVVVGRLSYVFSHVHVHV